MKLFSGQLLIVLLFWAMAQKSNSRVFTNFVLQDFDGARLELRSVVDSNDVTLLSFWASWCQPCLKELVELNTLVKQNRNGRLQVVAVNIDVPKELIKAKKFVHEKKLRFSVLHDARGEVQKKYQVNAIPRLFVIDRKGLIRAEHRGYGDIREIEKEILKLTK